MKKILCLAVAGLTLSALSGSYEVTFKGLGQLTLTCGGEKGKTVFAVGRPAGGVYKGGVQRKASKFLSYAERVRRTKAKKPLPPTEPVPNCVVNVECRTDKFSMTYFLLPRFHDGFGLYDEKNVEKCLPEWQKAYALPPERVFTMRFDTDAEADRTLVYLDGSLLTFLKGVRDFTDAAGGKGVEILKKGPSGLRFTPGYWELPTLSPSRASAFVRTDAKLSLTAGPQTVAGVPMTVWAPADSLDLGVHRKMTNHRDLVWDPLLERSPWANGPEYMQWRVPGDPWLYAWVLCADIPQEGRRPTLGTQFAKFGRGCTNGNLDFSKEDLTEPAKMANAKKVGTLSYRKDGKTVTTPLWLVRHALDVGKMGARAIDQLSLDFDFVGTGTHAKERSSLQVFGCTLQVSPYRFEIANPVRGNIFEQGRDEQKTVLDLIANRDGVKGAFEVEICDAYWRTLLKGTKKFEIERKGERRHFDLSLAKYGLGWYSLNYTFFDDKDNVITRHSAAFTVLAPDDREAGYDSPYACWPLLNGYHGANPNREEQLDVMRKAGYRKTWHCPATNEVQGLPWKVTRSSVGLGHMQPGNPAKTRADFDRRLDKTVAAYREEFANYPHCEVIQLLHEQGGRDLCDELYKGKPAVRGEYRGWDFDTPGLKDKERGDWEVFFCTEYCKRMKREFPTKRIMIGNGSATSEKVASLMRRGFDLALVDQLGIESKGFQAMPELAANRESPGMLWALRETGRIFGYTNFTLNACNEYVFRPERPYMVTRDVALRRLFQVTDFSLRDYLVSLAHGCDIISTGHLEDCSDAYYDTNWGAGGQCTFYPYSYPKRLYTALAVLTRVLDAPQFSRRVPTGEPSTYALEFLRRRKVPDYGYAFWTPYYDATARLVFPAGTTATAYDWQGRARSLASGGTIDFGSTPSYVVSSKPVASVKVVRHYQTDLGGMKFEPLAAFTAETVNPMEGSSPLGVGNPAWGPAAYRGIFDYATERDEAVGGDVLVARLQTKEVDPRYGHAGGGAGGHGPGSGGSGGGAGGPGVAGGPKAAAGEGGAGRASDITGESLEYARGGRGGDGGFGSWTGDGADGRDGFGDGGAAGCNTYGAGGKGGDGVVIFSCGGRLATFKASDAPQKYTAPSAGKLRYLAIAGGGGGSATAVNYGGGGGGAGGMDEGELTVRAGETFTVTVGRGGQGGRCSRAGKGGRSPANGEDTVIARGGREVVRMLGGGAPCKFGGSSGGMIANFNSAAPGAHHSELEWAFGGVQLKNPVVLAYEPDTALAIRVFGNSSFGKIGLVVRGPDGKDVTVGGLSYRDYMCFHGWHTLVGRIPKELREPGRKFKVVGVWFGSSAWALDPSEMVPVTDPVKIRDVMLVRLPPETTVDKRLEAIASDVMKNIGDKDL